MKEVRKYHASYNKAFDCVIQAVNDCGFSIVTKNRQTGIINLSTGFSFRSWGETITIQISAFDGIVKISIESASKAQLIDWGKNHENIDAIITTLDQCLRSEE